MSKESFVTLAEAAEMLGIKYQTVYGYWSRGKIPYERSGVSIMVRPSIVRDALKDHKPRRFAVPRKSVSL